MLNFWFTRCQTLTDTWSLKLALGFLTGLGELLLRANDDIERLTDPRRLRSSPTRPNLPDVAQLFVVLLAEGKERRRHRSP